jgi:hypothetical protein
VEAGPSVESLLRDCSRSAVHLEMRDGYLPDDPGLLAWRQGRRIDADDRGAWWNDWYELIHRTVQRGVSVRRARIVSQPVSEYIRYEYDHTFMNTLSGEDVRWLNRRNTTDIALPGNDFWLFDGIVLLVNHFSGDGDFVGGELVDSRDAVGLCSTAFETVWDRAVAHADFQAY